MHFQRFPNFQPVVIGAVNVASAFLPSIIGQPPPPVPVPPPPPPPPEVIVNTDNPSKPITIYITHPPQTTTQESLTIYSIILLVLIFVMCLFSCAGGAGFWYWQNKKMEKEKRDQGFNGCEADFMENGGRRGGKKKMKKRGTSSGASSVGTTKMKTRKI
ncbi:hypothetical protein L5515_009374 [Caenorhabditis briggsae]|uniref:Uncharacterized protein n=1 Tax=Caenorhabditis briggsae TaxID=6238 RepID=A0AAE9F9M2_CAEBR|nr:hypothetical protein L5515_009374 [Caenorhabditis briggsae]